MSEYSPHEDQRFRPRDKAPVGACEWCGEPAWVRVVIKKGSSGKVFKAAVLRLACPSHASRFAREEAEIRQ